MCGPPGSRPRRGRRSPQGGGSAAGAAGPGGVRPEPAGRLHDDLSLRLLYAAADVFVIPSRQDNLPNTGLEAQACATPVVAFATGGLVDIVDHRIIGALAEPFDPLSIAAAIRAALECGAGGGVVWGGLWDGDRARLRGLFCAAAATLKLVSVWGDVLHHQPSPFLRCARSGL